MDNERHFVLTFTCRQAPRGGGPMIARRWGGGGVSHSLGGSYRDSARPLRRTQKGRNRVERREQISYRQCFQSGAPSADRMSTSQKEKKEHEVDWPKEKGGLKPKDARSD